MHILIYQGGIIEKMYLYSALPVVVADEPCAAAVLYPGTLRSAR
jgi:hypothetical protein